MLGSRIVGAVLLRSLLPVWLLLSLGGCTAARPQLASSAEKERPTSLRGEKPAAYTIPAEMIALPYAFRQFRSAEFTLLVPAGVRYKNEASSPAMRRASPKVKSAIFTADMKTQVTPVMDIDVDWPDRADFASAVLTANRVFVLHSYRAGDSNLMESKWFEVLPDGRLVADSVPWKSSTSNSICSTRHTSGRRYLTYRDDRWLVLDENLQFTDDTNTSAFKDFPYCTQLDADHIMFSNTRVDVVASGPELIALGEIEKQGRYKLSHNNRPFSVYWLKSGRVLLFDENGLMLPSRILRDIRMRTLEKEPIVFTLLLQDVNDEWLVMDDHGRIVADYLAHAELVNIARDDERLVSPWAVLIRHNTTGEWAVLQEDNSKYIMIGWSGASRDEALAAAVADRSRRVQEFHALQAKWESEEQARRAAEAEWRKRMAAKAAELAAQRAAEQRTRAQQLADKYRALMAEIDQALNVDNIEEARRLFREIDGSLMMEIDRQNWLSHRVKWARKALDRSNHYPAPRETYAGYADFGLEILHSMPEVTVPGVIFSAELASLKSDLALAAFRESSKWQEYVANLEGLRALRQALAGGGVSQGNKTPTYHYQGITLPTPPPLPADQHYRWKYEYGMPVDTWY